MDNPKSQETEKQRFIVDNEQSLKWVLQLMESKRKQIEANLAMEQEAVDFYENKNNALRKEIAEWHLVDPRKARPKQRALFWALMGDIARWNGYEPDDMRYYFYNRFMIRNEGKEISLSDTTTNSVTDAKDLIDDVIDYIFAFRVPVKAGYELLPRDEEHYQFQCIRHQMCVICGRKADIHHIDEIGMGRDRTRLNHTKFHLMALCREHHTELHKIGPTAFGNKYHLNMRGIKIDADTLKQIGVRGNYGSESI